jgi:CheY-like chemotaxis protein
MAGGRAKRVAFKGRVLVVDEEQGFREGLADFLQIEGYEVSMARNAVEAVTLVREFCPDVMVLNLRMSPPDGESFLRGMRGLPALRHVPVVLISGKEGLAEIAQWCGAAVFAPPRSGRS